MNWLASGIVTGLVEFQVGYWWRGWMERRRYRKANPYSDTWSCPDCNVAHSCRGNTPALVLGYMDAGRHTHRCETD